MERRRCGLERFLAFAVNHPVLKHDGLLAAFLTEPSDLSAWRKSHPYNLTEESASRSLTPQEEQSIPKDLETKLTQLRQRLPQLVEHWTKVTSTVDRIAHRRSNQGADWLKLSEALEGARETESAGWRLPETEEVAREEAEVATGAGRVGLAMRKAARLALEGTAQDLKRVSLRLPCCGAFAKCAYTDWIPLVLGSIGSFI